MNRSFMFSVSIAILLFPRSRSRDEVAFVCVGMSHSRAVSPLTELLTVRCRPRAGAILPRLPQRHCLFETEFWKGVWFGVDV